ncbi:SDR family NAD(P)-dependent oxidoreductase [Catenuloplanes indicus]|uniref:Short-subunit dehydrogenase n=1 Tax=Catenuloplanes indicus TaxID=137267 RepID=A0AAE3VV50_9ACTN|nr:SDR family oxidoreductase [Catenuloplanes indicus]MDQ0364269.1 short-subunit dehydrogenase [Catenuloplanes indicus]
MDYTGITALVTGASKGIGRAYAHELARRGAHVALLARSAEALDALAAEIRTRHPVDAHPLTADLSTPDGPAHAVRDLAARKITIDLLINNAGAGTVGPFLHRPYPPQRRNVDLNVHGLMALTHALGGQMITRGRGGIINVSSTAAFQPMPYQAGYAATKAFVLSFSEALAHELRGTGVHVMAAHPGAVATGFFDGTTAVMDPRVTDSPDRIAAKTLDDFARGRLNSYPGRPLHRVQTIAARLLPRATTVRATGALNRRLGHHTAKDL